MMTVSHIWYAYTYMVTYTLVPPIRSAFRVEKWVEILKGELSQTCQLFDWYTNRNRKLAEYARFLNQIFYLIIVIMQRDVKKTLFKLCKLM